MNLEDHVGDIVRKARMMANVSSADAAARAGLSETEFSSFEDSSRAGKQPNYAALAELLGLNAAKLEGI
ncbi:MAG TPA: helix-turn-helix transcriptional regulator, partial [Verrucomicrobiae bacterium]|nr:helix-turn-helix transcriptional regulator [Verrucomicrobiae bacterium]